MSKNNLFTKNLKKQILSINTQMESIFNKIKYFKSNYKKFTLTRNNRVFLVLSSVVILTLTYFFIPTFYDKDKIQIKIKNHILKKYKIDLKFNEGLNYGLLPKPHFSSKNSVILRDKNEIASIDKFKIFISVGDFFSFNEAELKDLTFKKADFNIYKNDLMFFKELLNIEPNENKILIKDSTIFFKNNLDEVIFINKIKNSKFFYDSNKLANIFSSNNEIFNVPYKLLIINDKFNKKVSSNFSSKKIRLNIDNVINYDQNFKEGFLDILFINKSTSLNYKLKKNSFEFISKEKTNFYEGKIDFKPFYFSANFNYDGLSSKNLFNNNSILYDLIISEIFNNINLNVDLNFKVRNIVNSKELNNLFLKVGIEEGAISLTNSNIMWKDDLEIILKESVLNYDNNEVNLIGKMIIKVIDKDDFFSSYQIKKLNRKDIELIEFDFAYNLSQRKINFDNVRVDNSTNENLDRFISKFNNQEDFTFNRVRFINFVSNFFSVYAG